MGISIVSEDAARRRDRLSKLILDSALGAFNIFTIFMGYKLGFYRALAHKGWLNSDDLASITGTHERYVREWLEQQTVAGILVVDHETSGPHNRRYRLPAGHEEVLADHDNLNFLAPLAQIVIGAGHPISTVIDAYRTGEGVPYSFYGDDLREGQSGMNRAMFLKLLGREWLPSIPDLDARLKSEPSARIADIGCGTGWSSIGMAQGYPTVRVDGFDLDAPSIETAIQNAARAGVSDRVKFHHQDASDPMVAGKYDLVTAFECIHDLSDPVGALKTMLNLVSEAGVVLVMDERVGETFSAKADEVDQIMYGFSVLHCLPVGLASQPSAETGTVMRPEVLEGYAQEAGFCDIDILPIDNFFFRFYRLNPICTANEGTSTAKK